MPVTDQDVRALTYLAKRLRDETSGAGKWDEAGIAAKVHEMLGQNLAVTIERVTRHATDMNAKTPGAILRPFIPPANTGTTPPEHIAPVDRCSICSLHRDRCAQLWQGEHEFTPSHRRPERDGIHDRVQAMKSEAARHVRPPDPEKVPPPIDPNVERLREAKAAPIESTEESHV